MTFHLYAITDSSVEVPELGGIDGSRLERLPVDGLTAVVSDVGAQTEATEAAVLAHAAVVDALAQTPAAVLPARFGRGYDSREEVTAAVTARESQLQEALGRVRGCVELGVRVFGEPVEAPPGAAPRTGRTYMLDRLGSVRAAERLQEELETALAPLAQATTSSVAATAPLAVTAAYLVLRGEVETFRARVDALAHDRPELTLICTGPWPAYSFATVDATQP